MKIEWIEGRTLDGKIPPGPLHQKWQHFKDHQKLVAPNNKRKLEIIVVGTGLAGGSAAAALGELGYQVKCFTFHDSPRRAHSIAAQGGINAAKNYQNDGDTIFRLFYDTIKGGDYRSREANVYRLAEISLQIIDHCVAIGVPNHSTAKSPAAQSPCTTATNSSISYSSTAKPVVSSSATSSPANSNATAPTPSSSPPAATAISTTSLPMPWAPTCPPHGKPCAAAPTWLTPASSKYTPPVSPKAVNTMEDVLAIRNKQKNPRDIPPDDRDYFLERMYPAFGNLVPRDVAARAIKKVCDEGRGVNATSRAVFLDFEDAILRYGKSEASLRGIENASQQTIIQLGKDVIKAKYGNLFQMYEKITGVNPYDQPMTIYPAVHYTMGGLWVDYELQTNIPGLFALGECNFSDHGANRLGASALMQGLADGFFILPYTISNYLADKIRLPKTDTNHPAFDEAEQRTQARLEQLISVQGNQPVEYFHRQLGKIMWNYAGISRTAESLLQAIKNIRALREEFWKNVFIPGKIDELNPELDKANRVADFLELGELIAIDAYHRNESCGGHFREEYQTPDGEPLRNDHQYAYVAAWEWTDPSQPPTLHKEPLVFENVKPSTRSYK